MTLLTMTVPDDPAELPRWLEQRLLAPDFGQFLAELTAHFPVTAGAEGPHHLMDQWLPVALEEGLAPIPPDVLSQLLRHPAVLAEFQEKVVINGGPYWDELLDASGAISESLRRGKVSLERVLSADRSPAVKVVAATPRKSVPSGPIRRDRGRGYRIWAMSSTAIAVCLVAAVAWLATRGPEEPPVLKSQIAWGWAKPSGLAVDQPDPRDYLNKLAANAEEWSLYRPSDANGIATRIAEMRLGCTRLMHSGYGPLSPADKAWLLEHCREWAKTLDQHQQALDAGADPLTVRAGMDETIRDIAATLREKAKQVG